MALSCFVLKNSYLRVSIPAGPVDAELLGQLQSEFLRRFESAGRSDTIVVDFPSTHRPSSGLVRLLSAWQRLAAHSGRRFRINGVSRVIADVQQQLSPPLHSISPV